MGMPYSRYPVHRLKDFFPLDVDVQGAFLALLLQPVRKLVKRQGTGLQIHQHDHREILLHQRLADVEDVDVPVGKQRRHIGGDAARILGEHTYDGFFHVVPPEFNVKC